MIPVSKDEWDIKEGNGKSMKINIVHVLWAKVTFNRNNIKPKASAMA